MVTFVDITCRIMSLSCTEGKLVIMVNSFWEKSAYFPPLAVKFLHKSAFFAPLWWCCVRCWQRGRIVVYFLLLKVTTKTTAACKMFREGSILVRRSHTPACCLPLPNRLAEMPSRERPLKRQWVVRKHNQGGTVEYFVSHPWFSGGGYFLYPALL